MITTLEGALRLRLLLLIATTVQPTDALFSVTVHVPEVPPVKLAGLQVTKLGVTAATRVIVALAELLPRMAVTVADWLLETLVVLALKVGNLSTYNVSESYQLQAYFSNIGGLKSQASIRSAGVLVGRVTGVTLDTERYEAKVVMSIDKRYQFPKDTFANILTSGLLGEQYVGLDAGSDSTMLKDGEKLKITQSAVVLEKLIGQFLYNKAADGGTK